MDALIFDFDGVVVDSEPLHLQAFQAILEPEGVELSRPIYYGRYLGYDDKDCFQAIMRDFKQNWSPQKIKTLSEQKTRLTQEYISERAEPVPGTMEIIREAVERGIPLAICSGSLREEVYLGLQAAGVTDYFPVVVTAEDVAKGKPDPEGYELARTRLAEAGGKKILPARCVVCEDSPAGIYAAKSAGMRVIALMTGYPKVALAQADKVVKNLARMSLDKLDTLLGAPC
jgi:beta-phosphoglucomutase